MQRLVLSDPTGPEAHPFRQRLLNSLGSNSPGSGPQGAGEAGQASGIRMLPSFKPYLIQEKNWKRTGALIIEQMGQI